MHVCACVLAVAAGLIAPAHTENDTPPDERLYTFDKADVTYAELIAEFARQADLRVVGEPPCGHTPFRSCGEPISFQLAISRINTLLFVESCYLRWNPDFDELAMRSMGTHHFPLENIFPTVGEFLDSDKGGHELVAVLVKPRNTISDWPSLCCLIPSYVRSSEYAESNDIVFLGAITDVQRYVPLAQMMGAGPHDHYRIRKFNVEAGVASQIAKDLESRLASVDIYQEPRHVSDEGSSEETLKNKDATAPEVLVWYDDVCGSLVVRYIPELENSVVRVILEASARRDRGRPPVPIP